VVAYIMHGSEMQVKCSLVSKPLGCGAHPGYDENLSAYITEGLRVLAVAKSGHYTLI
jgi:hypothetical protein